MHSNINVPNYCTLAHIPHMVCTVFIIHLEYDIQYKKVYLPAHRKCMQYLHGHSKDTWMKPRNTNSQKLHHEWAALALFLRSQCMVFLPVHVIVATFLATPHFLFLSINFYSTTMMIYVTFQNLAMTSSQSIQVREMPKDLLTSNALIYQKGL